MSPLDLGSELDSASTESEHPQPEVASAPALVAEQRRHVVADAKKPPPMTTGIASGRFKPA
jgi:hypothetical protein